MRRMQWAGAIVVAAAAAVFLWWRDSEPAPGPQERRRPLKSSVMAANAATAGGLSGLVVGPAGQGIAGAFVTALQQGRTRHAAVTRSTRTEPGGRFTFDRLPTGLYLVMATAPGFTTAFRGDLEVEPGPPLEDVRIRLWSGGVTLSGRVLDAGGGVIPGARVRATGYDLTDDGTHEGRSFQTDADGEGRYRMQLPKGRHRLQADADGYSSAMESIALFGSETRDLSLHPGARLSGRVVSAGDRQPVAGARVSIRREQPRRDEAVVTATADDTGTFAIGSLPPGTYSVTARSEGLLGTLAQAIVLEATDAVEGLELALAATITLRGRVTTASGTPVTLARILLAGVDPSGRALGPIPQAVTDVGGRYAVDGILPGSYRLAVRAQDYAQHAERIALPASGSRDVVLHPSAVVSGVVLTAAGKPVSGVFVRGHVDSSRPESGVTAVSTTDAQGRFSLTGLGAGDLVVTARDHDQAGQVGPEPLETGGRKQVVLRLGPGARVEGLVSWDDGSPVAGAAVISVTKLGDGMRMESRTAADGRFTLRGLPPGEISLRAAPPGIRDDTSSVPVTLLLAAGENRREVALVLRRP